MNLIIIPAQAVERIHHRHVRRFFIVLFLPGLWIAAFMAALGGTVIAWWRMGFGQALVALGGLSYTAAVLPVAWGKASWR